MRLIKIILLLLSILSITSSLFAGIVFEDNFNTQPDWSPSEPVGSNVPLVGYSDSYASSSGTPVNWSAWGIKEGWHPTAVYYPASSGASPTISIKNNTVFDSTGKVFVVSNESMSRTDQAGWSNDGWVGKVFDSNYPEIYLKLRIKFPIGFKRYWGSGSSAAFKIMRVQHWDRTHPFTQYFDQGGTGPVAVIDPSQGQYGQNLASDSIRCTPVAYDYVNHEGLSYRAYTSTPATGITGVEPPASPWQNISYNASYPAWSPTETYYTSNYSCVNQSIPFHVTKAYFTTPSPTCSTITGYPSDVTTTVDNAQGIFDGEWHTLKLHVKLNSAPGVKDGVYELTYDGCLIKSLTDIKYIGLGDDGSDKGFNSVLLGGNSYNNYAGLTYTSVGNPSYTATNEQEYAIDDVVVSTTDIPNEYVIGSLQVGKWFGNYRTGTP